MNRYVWGIIKIIFFTFVAVSLIYILFTLFNGQSLLFNLSHEQEPTIILQSIVLEDNISDLEIEWFVGGVEITQSTDHKIHIIEKSSKAMDQNRWVTPIIEGGKLILNSNNQNRFMAFFFASPVSYLELQLPKKTYDSLNATFTSGKYTITDLKTQEFRLSMTSGKLNVSHGVSKTMNVKFNSGMATFDDVSSNVFDLEMTSGSATYLGKIKESCGVEMTSGNLNLDISQAVVSQFDLEMTSGNANVTLSSQGGFEMKLDKSSGKLMLDSSIDPISEKEYRYLDGKSTYNVEMTSGSLKIKLN